MVYWVTDKMNFSAMKTEQFSKRTLLFLKFTFDGVKWKNCGINISENTTFRKAKETRLFILLRKSLVTVDPWFETRSQICFVVRKKNTFGWINYRFNTIQAKCILVRGVEIKVPQCDVRGNRTVGNVNGLSQMWG